VGAERRKHERVRCNFACFIARKKEPVRALVLDVSDGGLQIEAEITPPDQGFPLRLTLRPPTGKTIDIEGLVWHVKPSRKRGLNLVGLVLSQAPDEYFSLVATLRESNATESGLRAVPKPRRVPRKAAPPAAPEGPAPGGAPAAPAAPGKDDKPVPRLGLPRPERRSPGLQRHAIRVKQQGGPRTCRLVVAASNPQEAKELALSEVGAGWDVLGVTPL
jgi:hypothetical protein